MKTVKIFFLSCAFITLQLSASQKRMNSCSNLPKKQQRILTYLCYTAWPKGLRGRVIASTEPIVFMGKGPIAVVQRLVTSDNKPLQISMVRVKPAKNAVYIDLVGFEQGLQVQLNNLDRVAMEGAQLLDKYGPKKLDGSGLTLLKAV